MSSVYLLDERAVPSSEFKGELIERYSFHACLQLSAGHQSQLHDLRSAPPLETIRRRFQTAVSEASVDRKRKCPVCGKPLTQSEFDRALGLWKDKQEHIQHLEEERKKLRTQGSNLDARPRNKRESFANAKRR